VVNMLLSQLLWSVLQPSKSKLVYMYKIKLSWSGKTYIFFYICQLNRGSKELTKSQILDLIGHSVKCKLFWKWGCIKHSIILKYDIF